MGYVRQANIAHGPQQVNNGTCDDTPRTQENQNSQNKLMEQKDGERLDIGTTSMASQAKLIQQWRPWERSTGPKTKTGKEKISQNAYKGSTRKQLRELAAALREQRRWLNL
jgi:hypothetical protein